VILVECLVAVTTVVLDESRMFVFRLGSHVVFRLGSHVLCFRFLFSIAVLDFSTFALDFLTFARMFDRFCRPLLPTFAHSTFAFLHRCPTGLHRCQGSCSPLHWWALQVQATGRQWCDGGVAAQACGAQHPCEVR